MSTNQPQELHIFKDNTLWQEAVIGFIVDVISDSLTEKDHCSISLSGGSTPRQIYERLAKEGVKRGINWETVHFYWGDERAVPHTHPDSNYKMVKEALLDHIDISAENVHPMPTPDQPESSASVYGLELQTKFAPEGNSFDLSLLGLGDDGHTASIFPHTDLVREQRAWVKEVYLEDKDVYRISVTAPVINRSRYIAFLVTGRNKADALKEVLHGEENPEEYPAQLIRKSPNVHFFLDRDAAGEIEA
ncbi:6-phosphogluconolactonase [Membranicola marinus]|uniref:6-phosphogluconolactonase n=1 Tax=Membranihabitans marinus TaxID=1227546 RepID=A0A953I0A1_9BACT|nr:6-phosphogluconolactonase [Membranihabitans marinus]MBY5958922.1 6-phosphogluconolactonase [Membranihabitans marinus]